jgi:PST family polysaccharide transporter
VQGILGPLSQTKILAFLPFIIALSNIFGIQLMLTLNYKRVLIMAGSMNIILALIFVPVLKHIGISIFVLLSGFFVTFEMLSFLNKEVIKIIGGRSCLTTL